MAEINGSFLRPILKPKLVEIMAEYKHREGIGRVVEAACGLRHVLCVTEKGHVFAWGDNRLLQLGVVLPMLLSQSTAWKIRRSVE